MLEEARHLAAQHGQSVITANQLLLGLLQVPESLGVQVLRAFPFRLQDLETRVSATVYMDARDGGGDEAAALTHRRLAFSPEGAAILRAAHSEAAEQGVAFVDTRALLLGMLRESQTSAGQILQQFEVSLAEFRARADLAGTPPQDLSASAPRQRRAVRLSPFFLALALVFAGSGVLLQAGIGEAGRILFLFVLLGWVISLALHEFGHAIVAYRSGDESVAERGYLSLDPLRYTHPLLSILLPLVFLLLGGIPLPGGAVYIQPRAIRTRLRLSLTSAAGPLATALCALLLLAPFVVDKYVADWGLGGEFWAGVALLAFLLTFALFLNLLPLPGLDGFGILEPYLPPRIQQIAAGVKPWGLFLLFAGFVFTPLGGWMAEAVLLVMYTIAPQAAFLAGVGYDLFFFWR